MLKRRAVGTVLTYVVEMVGFGLVKIGKTSDLASRLNNIQSCNPFQIRLVARLRGDVESMLHTALADNRVRGEWFKYDDKAKQYINMLDKYEIGEPVVHGADQ